MMLMPLSIRYRQDGLSSQLLIVKKDEHHAHASAADTLAMDVDIRESRELESRTINLQC